MGAHMKTTIEISDPLLEEARRVATERGLTLREIVETGLRQVVQENQEEFKLPDRSVGGNGLRPELAYEDWGRILELAYGGSK